MSNNFRFFVPIDNIEKGTDEKGEEVMRVAGLASTKTKDMDGESLDPNNFDISYLCNKGIINYNHSTSPDAIIGEPEKAEIRKEGLWVQSILYPTSKLAKSVWNLANTLQTHSKTRRMGYSIEGKALSRDPLDKSRVTKALITNIALTVSPKNPDSIVNIMKGNFNELEDSELKPIDNFDELLETAFIEKYENIVKSMDAEGNGEPLVKESVEGGKPKKNLKKKKEEDDEDEDSDVKEGKPSPEDKKADIKTLTKSAVIEKILKFGEEKGLVINFQKANQIFNTINSLAMAKKEQKTAITEDVLEKAFDVLGLQKSATAAEAVADESGSDDTANDDISADTEGTLFDEELEKSLTNLMKGDKADDAGDDEGEEETEDDEEGNDADSEGKDDVKKGLENELEADTDLGKAKDIELGFADIQKSFQSFQSRNSESFKSVGILLKSIFEKVEKVSIENEELHAEIASLKGNVEELSGLPKNIRKSATSRAVAAQGRVFTDNDVLLKGFSSDVGLDEEPVTPKLSISRDRHTILKALDDLTFKGKDFDPVMAHHMTTFESSGSLAKAAQDALQKSLDVQLVK